MTEDEQTAHCLAMIDLALAELFNELREYMRDCLNDTYSEGDVETKILARRMALYYAQRMIIEITSDEHGRAGVAQAFDNMYYQIAARHIGPRDFTSSARPYDKT